MIYFVATLIFGFFALAVLCIFGIISGVSGLRDIKPNPHWGFSFRQLEIKDRLTKLVVDLFFSLTVSLIALAGCSVVAYHLIKGPTL